MSLRFAFYGRVSTEDAQDPEASRSWQKRRAIDLITPHGGVLVSDYFDVGQSRSLPWKRRPEASRLLVDVTARDRGFDAVVIGEPARAFYGPQFALTFPVLTHYGVGLWVPEVGGAVDPGSEAHDLVMTLFGGMSKGERARIQMRVRTAMSALAQDTTRYLGGRPPYGYRLVDAGPHPNPAKANLGQRLHRLDPDPATSSVVERIYRMYADGAGLRYIAQQLTGEGVPSPSQYDPARNRHRDPRGWSHSAIRAILDNPAYRGIRVWGKQEKYEVLVNPEDVAAGYETRMRWRAEADWIAPDRRTHEALISDQLAQAVRLRTQARRGPGLVCSRESTVPYALRGLLFCAACGRRMQGAARPGKQTTRILYRCELGKSRSVPVDLSDHPRTVYLREDEVIARLDEWIATLANPDDLARGQDMAPAAGAGYAAVQREISDVNSKIAALVAAVESGVAVEDLTAALRRRTAERDELRARLERTERPHVMSAAEISELVEELGGLSVILGKATGAERAQVYASLGLRLDYDPHLRQVTATADLSRVARRVRGGT
ncbi:putative recombinase [Mycolicibacterium insubricum]|uniref:Serine recombinase n=1 Tax=Mycolicibacterium insubricum TaxID=444597 RepID=A0A1X0DIX0_9MYCO|nr:recombinase family protein [Mycolicibacterium insubricum]MCB9441380.1 recombinase family protein [Mycolicibacterium sp.]MCV7081092.1 recombinase family protein [Mycolicibacterium insubricum]ORA72344.1 serine recombinase [Mycolicibacterium insubricum]BBZ67639.1 putative recombinase [Mycolicibacterium insubricum]